MITREGELKNCVVGRACPSVWAVEMLRAMTPSTLTCYLKGSLIAV